MSLIMHGVRWGIAAPTPASGNAAATAAEPPTTRRAFDIGGGTVAVHAGDDSWGVVGQTVKLHNSFWGYAEDEYSECVVVGYMGEHQFSAGARSKHTYVVECEGHFYPARHSAIAGAIVDEALKRRVRKMPPPRLV